MKQKNVIFSLAGVRIVTGSYTPQEGETVLVNPVIPRGLPLHYWKIRKGKIVVMSGLEKQIVDEKVSITNSLSRIPEGTITNKQLYMIYTKYFLTGMAGALFLHLLIKLL